MTPEMPAGSRLQRQEWLRLLYGFWLWLTFLGGRWCLLLRLLYRLGCLAGLNRLHGHWLTRLCLLIGLIGLTLLVRWPGLTRLIRWWVLPIRGRKHRAAHALHNGYSQSTQNDGNAEWEQNPRPETSREAESQSE